MTSAVYNLTDPAQAAELLATLPSREYRSAVMARWRRHYGADWARQVGEALRAAGEARAAA